MATPELPKLLPWLEYSLSLMYGHRTSIDLDLFCINKFDESIYQDALMRKFGQKHVDVRVSNHFGIFCFIDGVSRYCKISTSTDQTNNRD